MEQHCNIKNCAVCAGDKSRICYIKIPHSPCKICDTDNFETLESLYNNTAERMKKMLVEDLTKLRISAISRGADVNKLNF